LGTGNGEITINGRTMDDFFPRDVLKTIVRQPLMVTELAGAVEITAHVNGGGVAGQAGALRHGISRALLEMNPELRGKLKAAGFLTRDARCKERRKYGQKGARARFQFSKR
jgi:small subunit ribosomal protein S9